MKKQIIILALMLNSMALFSQIWADEKIEYRIDEQQVPSKLKPKIGEGIRTAFSSAKNDEIWRPFNSYTYGYKNPYPAQPNYENTHRYDTTGMWHQTNERRYGDTFDEYITVGNYTFTKEGFDFEDTLIYYTKKGNVITPSLRYYADYHYYDLMPEDSFYYAIYIEKWNDVSGGWEKHRKEYVGHFDTITFVIRETYSANFINGEWKKYQGALFFRNYNEEELVISRIMQVVNFQTGEYETQTKSEYFYNEDKVHKETYLYTLNGDYWKLYAKCEYKYVEWYPNGQETVTTITDGEEYVAISGKRVKIKSITAWRLNSNDEWECIDMSKQDWDINGTKSHTDSIYYFYNGFWYLDYVESHLYDERGNYIKQGTYLFERIDMFGNVVFNKGSRVCIYHTYHPIYDELEKYGIWDVEYNKVTKTWDSMFRRSTEYFNWHDVRYPVSITEPEAPPTATALFIYPNPTRGELRIEERGMRIEDVQIFDVLGRSVLRHSCESRNPLRIAGQARNDGAVIIDVSHLPAGMYLVRAVLADGGVRTGKVVVR